MKRFAVFLALLCSAAFGEDKLVVHEWGTFTSLQDEDGNAIGGINTDDEPVPQFVHRIAYNVLLSPTEAPSGFFQGAPSCHPDVTMRLETPVIYFHPPAGWNPRPVDVHVAFNGGWLTEFYPNADFRDPGFESEQRIGHIRKDAAGELSWKGLAIGTDARGPETKERVWLAPRAVDAAPVTTGSNEHEKFLFYRGVGNREAALRVVRKQETLEMQDAPRVLAMLNAPENLRIHAAWLVEIASDGACAFRNLGPLEWEKRGSMPASLKDFRAESASQLRGQMREALIKEGLFPDEAEALLNTWRISYFKSPGLRLFYICPRVDVDGILPLEISAPSQITRVMMGRIEIVTPGQRALLKKLAAGPAPDLSGMRAGPSDFQHPENVAHWDAVMAGKEPYSALGLPFPELYGDYLKLGRFRNALILDEEKRRPAPALKKFIEENGFQAYAD